MGSTLWLAHPGVSLVSAFVCKSCAVGSVCKTRLNDPALFSICRAAHWSVGVWVTCKKWAEGL